MASNQIVYIRTDANSEIATGHVMRTLAIAKQIKKLGSECKFITADEYAKTIINDYGFETICLNSQWNDLEQEIPKMYKLIEEEKIRILLVDSYFVTERYLEQLNKKTYIAYIDDLNLFKYPVNLLINYSNYYDQFEYNKLGYNQETKFLLGSEYIPLREEFSGRIRSESESLKDILITTGGTDEYHITYLLLKKLCNNELLKEINLHVVIGRFNKDVEKIKQLAQEYNFIKIYQGIAYMSDLMMLCDLAISAGGTTLFELCACGLPTICFGIADNQLLGISSLANKGFMWSIGDIRSDIDKGICKIEKQVEVLKKDFKVLYQYSEKMQRLVDGKGAERIARCLLKQS